MALRWLVNLILLLVLLGLAFGIWQVRRIEETPPTLAGPDPGAVGTIEVERAGEPRLRLERTPEGWRMRAPWDLDADPGQVERLLGVVSLPVERSFPAQSAALDELGLAPPKLRLALDQTGFGFGGLDPLKQHRYVLAGSVVHLVRDSLYPRLIAPPIDYLARRPLPANPPPVFATLNGVPLAAPSLKAVAGLIAERLESMAPDLAGEPLEVKLADGTLLRFLLSPDRRRWTRADLRLCYVLGDGLLLELDPTAPDPGPPARPPTPLPGSLPAPGLFSGAGGTAAADLAESPSDRPPDQSAVVAPGAVDDGAPPVVRLRPDQPLSDAPSAEPDAGPVGFGAEPGKRPPQGFGVDPFAATPGEHAVPSEGGAAPRPPSDRRP